MVGPVEGRSVGGEATNPLHAGERKRRVVLLVLVAAVLASLVAGASASAFARARGTLWHDEMISLLAATGHQDDWAKLATADRGGVWSEAAQWQAFTEVDHATGFSEIGDNVARLDRHPPLYFWALGLVLALGVDPGRAGLALGVLLVGTTGALLALVLRRWLPPPVVVIGTLLWATSPVVGIAAAEARQYVLLALCGLGLTHAAVRVEKAERFAHLELVVWTAAGILTGPSFAPLVAVVVVTLVLVSRRDLGRASRAPGAAAAGLLIALAAFPELFSQAARVRGAVPGFDRVQLDDRARVWLLGVADVVRPSAVWSARWTLVACVLGVAGLVFVATRRRSLTPVSPATVVVAAGIVAASALGYTLGLVPEHAVGTRYITPAWTLVAVLVALVLGLAGRTGIAALIVVVALLGVSTLFEVHEQRMYFAPQRETIARVEAADTLVVDCTRRGYLPGLVRLLQPDAQVVALATDSSPEPLPVDPGRAIVAHADCYPGGLERLDAQLGALGFRRGELVGPLERFAVWALVGR